MTDIDIEKIRELVSKRLEDIIDNNPKSKVRLSAIDALDKLHNPSPLTDKEFLWLLSGLEHLRWLK